MWSRSPRSASDRRRQSRSAWCVGCARPYGWASACSSSRWRAPRPGRSRIRLRRGEFKARWPAPRVARISLAVSQMRLAVAFLALLLISVGAAGATLPRVTHDGRPYVELRRLAESLDRAGFEARPTSMRARLRFPGHVVTFTRNWSQILVNETPVVLDAPVRVRRGVWLVPESFVGRVLPRLTAGVTVAAAPAAPRAPAPEVALEELRFRSYPSFTRIVVETSGPHARARRGPRRPRLRRGGADRPPGEGARARRHPARREARRGAARCQGAPHARRRRLRRPAGPHELREPRPRRPVRVDPCERAPPGHDRRRRDLLPLVRGDRQRGAAGRGAGKRRRPAREPRGARRGHGRHREDDPLGSRPVRVPDGVLAAGRDRPRLYDAVAPHRQPGRQAGGVLRPGRRGDARHPDRGRFRHEPEGGAPAERCVSPGRDRASHRRRPRRVQAQLGPARPRRRRARADEGAVSAVPRPDGRAPDQLRPVTVTRDFLLHPEGSVLVEFGATKVICTASLEDKVPPFMKVQGQGWVTAEYAMLPRSTNTRTPRENRGPSGRSQEIQRLVGRALRAVIDRAKLGERTVWVDCDVIQADGGTPTAAITGGFVAVADAIAKIPGQEPSAAIRDHVAAISVGVVQRQAVLDLCYAEDSSAEVDMNVVMTGGGEFVEVQGTAEQVPFGRARLDALLAIAEGGIRRLVRLQRRALDARAERVFTL